MVLGLLKNLPILNSFLGKPASTKESLETEAAAKANEKAIEQEGLKPLFIVALPEGDFSELKAKLKEKFNGRDLLFELDPELKKPKLYILKPNALAKRNSETALDKAFIKDNYRSIELSGDGNKLGESLVKTMSSELISLKGAERKIEYAQKEAEKANSRQTLEKLSQMGVHVCSAECEEHKQRFTEEQIEIVRNTPIKGLLSLINHKTEEGRQSEAKTSKKEQSDESSKTEAHNTNEDIAKQRESKRRQNNVLVIRTKRPASWFTNRFKKTWSHLFPKLDLAKRQKETTSTQNLDSNQKQEDIQQAVPSHNMAQVQTAQKRREDLKAFFTKSQKFEDSHLDHNELIQASNSIYLLRNNNPDNNIDLAKIELTFAHRDNTTDNFTIQRLPLMDFLNGLELPASSEEINNKNFHSNEFHKGMISQSALSLLEAIEQNNSSQIKTVIEDSKQREEETKQQQTKRMNQKIGLVGGLAERTNSQNNDTSKINKPITDLKSLEPLIRMINIQGKQNHGDYRANVTKLGEALKLIKTSTDTERGRLEAMKELHRRFQEEISTISSVDSKEALKILSKLTTEKQDNSSFPSPWFIQNYIQSKDLRNKLLDDNTSQDFIIDYINSRIKMAQREDLSNLASNDTRTDLEQSNLISKTINSKLGNHFKGSEEQKDKQVGGIALTGQLSFIDRKDFHERNQTYKDFPELPESWKTEPKQTASNTNQTSPNHESTNPASTAADNSAKATETAANSNNSSPASNESSPQIITETHEEKQTINQRVNNNEA